MKIYRTKTNSIVMSSFSLNLQRQLADGSAKSSTKDFLSFVGPLGCLASIIRGNKTRQRMNTVSLMAISDSVEKKRPAP